MLQLAGKKKGVELVVEAGGGSGLCVVLQFYSRGGGGISRQILKYFKTFLMSLIENR